MRFAAAAALLLSVVSATAQNARRVSFRTLALDHAGELTEAEVPSGKPGEGPAAVPLYTASTSQVIEASFASGTAVLYQKGTALSDAPVVIAKGSLAKNDRQLFILIPVAKQEAGKPAYEIRAYDDDVSSFKMGSIRAINLAPVAIRFTVSGGRTPEIPSQRHAVFPHPKKVDDYNMYPAVVEFRSGTGDWVTGYSSSWKSTDRRREIVVTLVNPKTKLPEVKVFSDMPPWVEAQ